MENTLQYLPIQNFPTDFPWYKKLGSNITYYFSQIPLWKRKNDLSHSDIRKVWKNIQVGDIVLWGNFRELSWIFIDGVVTHALAHIWKGRCIHAFAGWVVYLSLKKVCRKYDTLVILRPRWRRHTEKYDFCRELISKLWKPYDFFFGIKNESESYFCTQLINDSLKQIGYDTELDSLRTADTSLDIFLTDTFTAHRALQPDTMIYGNFDVVYTSHNLRKEHGKYHIRGALFWKIIPTRK